MPNSPTLSDDEVTTLAGKVAVVLTVPENVDLTNLTLEDFKTVAAKAMERVDAGEGAPIDAVEGSATYKDTLKTTHPWGRPPTCDSDTMTDR